MLGTLELWNFENFENFENFGALKPLGSRIKFGHKTDPG